MRFTEKKAERFGLERVEKMIKRNLVARFGEAAENADVKFETSPVPCRMHPSLPMPGIEFETVVARASYGGGSTQQTNDITLSEIMRMAKTDHPDRIVVANTDIVEIPHNGFEYFPAEKFQGLILKEHAFQK